jgi:hypothetical protein
MALMELLVKSDVWIKFLVVHACRRNRGQQEEDLQSAQDH